MRHIIYTHIYPCVAADKVGEGGGRGGGWGDKEKCNQVSRASLCVFLPELSCEKVCSEITST